MTVNGGFNRTHAVPVNTDVPTCGHLRRLKWREPAPNVCRQTVSDTLIVVQGSNSKYEGAQ